MLFDYYSSIFLCLFLWQTLDDFYTFFNFIPDILAILSVQHQTIHIYQLDTDLGGFCPIVNIGRTLFDDDELLLSRTGNLNFRATFLFLSFTNHVIKILTFFDHPLTSCGQAWTFYLPPTYVHMDIFVPTPFYQLNVYFKI